MGACLPFQETHRSTHRRLRLHREILICETKNVKRKDLGRISLGGGGRRENAKRGQTVSYRALSGHTCNRPVRRAQNTLRSKKRASLPVLPGPAPWGRGPVRAASRRRPGR
eukprot:894390-Pyramimonas_sp.AAC.1